MADLNPWASRPAGLGVLADQSSGWSPRPLKSHLLFTLPFIAAGPVATARCSPAQGHFLLIGRALLLYGWQRNAWQQLKAINRDRTCI